MVASKLLVVAHHVVVKQYQELWTEVARQYPELTVEILCPRLYRERGPVRAEPLDAGRVRVHTLHAWFARQGRQHLHVYRGLGPVLDRVRPDWIFCSEEPNSLVTTQVLRAARRRSVPVLFWTSLSRTRVWNARYGRLNVRRYLFPGCQTYAFRHAAGAVATSPEARHVLRQRGYQGAVVCRPTHGVGASFLDLGHARLQAASGPSEPLRIGFVGHLEPVKGVDVLLGAFARMQHRSRARLVVRGEGPLASELRARAEREGIASEVEWAPFVSPSRMPEVYSELDVLVLPSVTRDGVHEKFGRVLVEAMAAGTVAVGSDDGGIPRALAGGGILFPPGDAGRLAEVLDELVLHPERWRQRQRAGHAAAASNYGYAALARGLVEEIRDRLGWFRTAA